MKKIKYIFCFTLLLLTFVSNHVKADGLTVKRFEDVSTTKQYARTQPKYDANRDVAALVLVQVLIDEDIDFTGAYLLGDVEKKASEYWVYMATGAKTLEVHCMGYEKLNVSFNDISHGQIPSLKSKCTYELVITVPGRENITKIHSQFFKFRVSPSDAIVRVVENGREELWDMVDGMAVKELRYGTYRYSVEADRHHKEEGEFTVSNNAATNERYIILKPQFGWLSLEGDSTSKDAYAYALNQTTNKMTSLGKIPFSKKELSSGVYTLLIKRRMYQNLEMEITISDAEELTLQPHLMTNYVNLTLLADSDAEVYNGLTKLGVGNWTGNLECGDYSIEVRKPNHYSSYTSLQVTPQTAGTSISLNVPIPIVGSLRVNGSPYDAAVYVDDNLCGATPLVVNELLVGEHTVKVQKDGFTSFEKQVTITENEEYDVAYALSKTTSSNNRNTKSSGGSLMITSVPDNAIVYIDGEKKGETPIMLNLLPVGLHTIRLEKEGYEPKEVVENVIGNKQHTVSCELSFKHEKAPQSLAAELETISVNGVSFTMVKVYGGTFTMGATEEQGVMDPYRDEYPTHQVTLADYYIGETEVTQELWEAVMGNNPSSFLDPHNPVDRVSWNDCQTFIKRLNRLTGQHFRLPTEEEWEYAARGGNKSKNYKYAGSNVLSDVAWYRDNSTSSTHPVGQKVPNELGLYDMSGNVFEWCQDWYLKYASKAANNSLGTVSGPNRIFRGGSWYYDARGCRISFRYYSAPTKSISDLGLRLAL